MRTRFSSFCLALPLLLFTATLARAADATVAQNGGGQFKSVQDAINAAPQTTVRPLTRIRAVNDWMRSYAAELERLYLENWADVPAGRGFTAPGRQILHCTFGSTLTHPELGQEVRQVLEAHPTTYAEVLADHFSRHLEALQAGM